MNLPFPYTGVRVETAMDVSQRLLLHHDGLPGLLRLDEVELARIRGLDTDGEQTEVNITLVEPDDMQ